jgi:hypothetical protein
VRLRRSLFCTGRRVAHPWVRRRNSETSPFVVPANAGTTVLKFLVQTMHAVAISPRISREFYFELPAL